MPLKEIQNTPEPQKNHNSLGQVKIINNATNVLGQMGDVNGIDEKCLKMTSKDGLQMPPKMMQSNIRYLCIKLLKHHVFLVRNPLVVVNILSLKLS